MKRLALAVAGLAMIAGDAAYADAPLYLELGAQRENLDRGFADWRSVYLEGALNFRPRHSLYGRLRETERFDLSDTELMAGWYYPLGERWTLLAEAAASPTHRVLAEWTALVQIERALGAGFNLQVGARHSEYPANGVDQGIVTLEYYVGRYRLAYRANASRLEGGGSALNNALTVEYYYSAERSRVGASYHQGEEIENVSGRGLVTTDVRGWALYGRHVLNDRWGLSYEISRQQQGDLYRRDGVRLGLRHQF